MNTPSKGRGPGGRTGTAPVQVTYYLEIFSSWCSYAEPAWADIKRSYAGRVDFEWKIARMRPGDFPVSREQCDWYYRRSGGTVMHQPVMLNSGWVDPSRQGHYEAPGLVAEAARGMGFEGDEIRLALAHAALVEGRQLGDMSVAVAVAVKAALGKLNAAALRRAALSPAVNSRVEASTQEFFSHQIDQRPAFVVTDAIGDKAVFSGLVRREPLAAAIEAMLADTAAYAAHAAHHGPPPRS